MPSRSESYQRGLFAPTPDEYTQEELPMPACTTLAAARLPEVGAFYSRIGCNGLHANTIEVTYVGPWGNWPSGYINDPTIRYRYYDESRIEVECYLRDFWTRFA